MASLTIRKLDENTKRKLRTRAARHGHSMEQEAREILQIELAKPVRTGKDFVDAIRRRFARHGGVDLEIPPRSPIRDSRIS